MEVPTRGKVKSQLKWRGEEPATKGLQGRTVATFSVGSEDWTALLSQDSKGEKFN